MLLDCVDVSIYLDKVDVADLALGNTTQHARTLTLFGYRISRSTTGKRWKDIKYQMIVDLDLLECMLLLVSWSVLLLFLDEIGKVEVLNKGFGDAASVPLMRDTLY
jgi:hypothetical protein